MIGKAEIEIDRENLDSVEGECIKLNFNIHYSSVEPTKVILEISKFNKEDSNTSNVGAVELDSDALRDLEVLLEYVDKLQK